MILAWKRRPLKYGDKGGSVVMISTGSDWSYTIYTEEQIMTLKSIWVLKRKMLNSRLKVLEIYALFPRWSTHRKTMLAGSP